MIKIINNRNIKNRLKKLGRQQGKIFINNNLCPYNKFLWGKCKELYTESIIDRFWVYNGHLYIADNQEDKKGTKILHFRMLQKKFPGFEFKSR